MANITQVPKTRIDTGVRGSPSTGDILYDGGNFINTNFNSIYNAFADQNLFAAAEGQDKQLIHATGFYQKKPLQDYGGNLIPLGSMHNLAFVNPVTINLPKGVQGQGVIFVNFDGSISPKNAVTIQCQNEDNIIGAGKQLIITNPNVRIEMWGSTRNEATGAVGWNYSITSMYGQKQIPIDKLYTITSSGSTFALAHQDQYTSMKLHITAETTGSNQALIKFKTCEVMLHVDKINKKVYTSEYAVIKNEDDFYTTAYSIDPATSLVRMNVKPTATAGTLPIKFAIKAVSTTSTTTVTENPGA